MRAAVQTGGIARLAAAAPSAEQAGPSCSICSTMCGTLQNCHAFNCAMQPQQAPHAASAACIWRAAELPLTCMCLRNAATASVGYGVPVAECIALRCAGPSWQGWSCRAVQDAPLVACGVCKLCACRDMVLYVAAGLVAAGVRAARLRAPLAAQLRLHAAGGHRGVLGRIRFIVHCCICAAQMLSARPAERMLLLRCGGVKLFCQAKQLEEGNSCSISAFQAMPDQAPSADFTNKT